MPDCSESGGCHQAVRRPRRVVLVVIGVGLLAVIACCLWAAGLFRDHCSADERLAEIEAARAIPDAENAATIYSELMEDPNGVPKREGVPTLSDERARERVVYQPWFAKDDPGLAAWIGRQQLIIDRLMDASQFEKCRFPLSVDAYDVNSVQRSIAIYVWAELLSMAANRDIAEGQIDAAIAKWRSLLQLANHLRQQPLLYSHLIANSIPQLAWRSISHVVVEGDLAEPQLQAIEALPLPTADLWAQYVQEIRAVENVQEQELLTRYGLLKRVKFRLNLWSDHITGKGLLGDWDQASMSYLSDIVQARSIRTFVALRRYRNTTGRWPESLDEIRTSLPAEALIDPFNKSPLVYETQGDCFRLYSTGWNKRDESRQRESEAGDDWALWPIQEREVEKNHASSKSGQ